jgi:hypothetical protein
VNFFFLHFYIYNLFFLTFFLLGSQFGHTDIAQAIKGELSSFFYIFTFLIYFFLHFFSFRSSIQLYGHRTGEFCSFFFLYLFVSFFFLIFFFFLLLCLQISRMGYESLYYLFHLFYFSLYKHFK